MGGGGQQTEQGEASAGGNAYYTWDQVKKHCHRNDQWLVINRKVYNVTQWVKRHPGGFRVISHYAGEDATVTTASPPPPPSHHQHIHQHHHQHYQQNILLNMLHNTLGNKVIFKQSALL